MRQVLFYPGHQSRKLIGTNPRMNTADTITRVFDQSVRSSLCARAAAIAAEVAASFASPLSQGPPRAVEVVVLSDNEEEHVVYDAGPPPPRPAPFRVASPARRAQKRW
jgi:hypothetical protein